MSHRYDSNIKMKAVTMSLNRSHPSELWCDKKAEALASARLDEVVVGVSYDIYYILGPEGEVLDAHCIIKDFLQAKGYEESHIQATKGRLWMVRRKDPR